MDDYEKYLIGTIQFCDLVIANRYRKDFESHYEKAIEEKKKFEKRLAEYRQRNKQATDSGLLNQ